MTNSFESLICVLVVGLMFLSVGLRDREQIVIRQGLMPGGEFEPIARRGAGVRNGKG